MKNDTCPICLGDDQKCACVDRGGVGGMKVVVFLWGASILVICGMFLYLSFNR